MRKDKKFLTQLKERIQATEGIGKNQALQMVNDLIDESESNQIKSLREEILDLIRAGREEMDAKEGHALLNPRSMNHWAVLIKEQSKDIELMALGMQDYTVLNMVLKMAVFCHSCLEEHVGHKVDELMPAAGMEIETAISEAKKLILNKGRKKTGDADTSPAFIAINNANHH